MAEMRRREKEVTDLNLLHGVMHAARVCRLGMVDGAEPYVIPLSFGFDGKDLYFHSAAKGRKVDVLAANDRVCVEFETGEESLKRTDRPCNWSVSYFSVIGTGRAERLATAADKSYGLNAVIRHYDPEAPVYEFTGQELAAVAVYRVTFAELTGKRSG